MLILSSCLENYNNSLREEKIIIDKYVKNPTKKNLKKATISFLKQREVTDEHLKQLHSDIPM